MAISQRKAGVLLTYVGEAIKILTGLIYTPVMLRLLGQSEYGLYQLVYSVVSYLSLLSLGFGSAYMRFYSRYKVQEDKEGIARLNGMFLTIFCTMSAMCVLCGSVMVMNAGAIFGDGLTAAELDKAKVLMALMVVNLALTFPNSVFNCSVTAHEKFLFQKLLFVLQNLLSPFLTLPLLLMGHGSVAVVVIQTALTFGVLISNAYYCFKKLQIRFIFRGFQFSLLKEMWVFTFFIFINEIINQANWSVDKFLLGRMIGTTATAVYGVGGQINSLYLQMSTAVSNVFVPKVNRIVAERRDDKELTKLFARVGRIQFIIMALILTGFIFFGKPFVRFWAGEGYENAYYVILFLIIPVTVPLIQNIGIEIQRAKNKHKARSLVYLIVAVANVFVSIPLIRAFGEVGAAAGTAIALTAGNILFMNWYYHKKIGIDIIYFWKEIAKFIPALIVPCLAGVVLMNWLNITGIVVLAGGIVVYTVIYCVSMWLLGINADEKALIAGLFRKIKKK